MATTLAIGIAGLVAFARRYEVDASAGTQQDLRIPGDGTWDFLNRIASPLLFGISLYFLFLVDRWAMSKRIRANVGSWDRMVTILVVVLLITTLHELGHTVTGPVARYETARLRHRSIYMAESPIASGLSIQTRTVLFDVLESLFVHSRRSAVGFAAFVGIGQNILSIDLVIPRMETKLGRFLRFCLQRRPEVTQPVQSFFLSRFRSESSGTPAISFLDARSKHEPWLF